MNAQPIDAGVAPSRRSRWQRRWPVIKVAVGTVMAVGAFLLWGPVGVGNGPLNAGIDGSQGSHDSGRGPVGFVIPIRNSGQARAVIDGVDIVGGTRYAGPHVLALEVLTAGRCGGAWPTRQTGRGFVLSGCGGADAGPLIGRGVGSTHGDFYGFSAAAEVAAPHPGTCWVMTKIVVRYHVGFRHYSASDPYQLAVCTSAAQVDSAMAAAETAS